jgi:hypothetical protein
VRCGTRTWIDGFRPVRRPTYVRTHARDPRSHASFARERKARAEETFRSSSPARAYVPDCMPCINWHPAARRSTSTMPGRWAGRGHPAGALRARHAGALRLPGPVERKPSGATSTTMCSTEGTSGSYPAEWPLTRA